MSAIAADLSPAERAERKAFLRRLRDLPPRPSADVVPIGRARKPLGLAPVLDGREERDGDPIHTQGERQASELVASSISHLSDEALAAPITWRAAFEDILSVALAGVFDGDETLYGLIKKLRVEIAEVKGAHREEIAELRLALTEARCEVREMRAVQESARVASRGEQGLPGPRGVPGSQGPAGPRGKQGERGALAAMVAAYEPRPERYELVPVLSDGSRGVPLALRSFFEQYSRETEPDEE